MEQQPKTNTNKKKRYEKDTWAISESTEFFFFNWDSPHARLNSHYEAWSYKKSTKRIPGHRKSV